MEYNSIFLNHGISEDEAKFLVGKYKQIESLTEIAQGYSLFAEFGFNPFSLYQVRPFKKIITASFELPSTDDVLMHTDLPFGITPKNGIVLPLIRGIGLTDAIGIAEDLSRFAKPPIHFSPLDLDLKHNLTNIGVVYDMQAVGDREFITSIERILKNHNTEMDKMTRKRYCFITSSAKNEEYDVDLTLPKMKGLIVGSTQNFLVHNMMRLIKKADITVTQPSLIFDEFYQNAKSIEDKVRIISNGREAVVMKE